MSRRNALIVMGLLVLAAVAAAVAWDRQRTQQLQAATLARIDAATRALRETAQPAPAIGTVARVQAASTAAARVDRDLAALRGSETGRILLLAAGADGYLLTARELLRRQAALLELRSRVAEGAAAFRAHLLGSRAAADWTGVAVRLKNRLEQDYREFRRTLDAYGKIAGSLPAAREALATLAPEDSLITAAEITALQDRTAAMANTLAGEIDAVRKLAAPR